MQLTGKTSIRGALTAVTAALLGSGAAHAGAGKKLESSLLLYSETSRVQAAEGLVDLSFPLRGNRTLNARFAFDGLTGASPNGAVPSNKIQTFTRPSGNGSYTVKPGEIPLDDTFMDTRVGFDGSLSQSLDRLTTVMIGTHLSAEHDYTSLGINAGLTRDLFRKNTTLSASAAFSHDVVSPLGGVPDPLTSMVAPADEGGFGEEGGEEEEGESGPGKGKNVFDAVFGITQVLDRKTILRLNYSLNHSSGYLNDPYKLISVVGGQSSANPGDPVDYIYEARPGSRTTRALYGEVRRYIGGHVIDLAYRYFWDDWGVTSQTFDLHYRLPLGGGHAIQPHLRWYRQTGADFYRTFLVDDSSLPSNISADYRLAPFHAMTIGLQYFLPVDEGIDVNFGAEYYRQAGDLSPPSAPGALSQYDLFPAMDAVMVRVGFSRDF